MLGDLISQKVDAPVPLNALPPATPLHAKKPTTYGVVLRKDQGNGKYFAKAFKVEQSMRCK